VPGRGAKGNQTYLGYLVLMVRTYALERLLGVLEGSLVTCLALR
jgi:hypothetical protein